MDIQVWLVENLFGGNAALFTSIWDIVQGVGLVVIAAFYKFYQVKATKVEGLFTKHSAEYNNITKEFHAIQGSVTASADILITMTLASASLDATAKQKIVGYAETLKQTNGITVNDATAKLIEAVVNLKEGRKQFADEANAIAKTAVETTTKTIEVIKEATSVSDNLPI
jgi:hypothetical protein